MDEIEKIQEKIGSYNSEKDTYSSKASEVNRTIALGGIGIIWLFRFSNATNPLVAFPNKLLLPIILLLISLLLDLFQYVYGAVLNWIIFRKKETDFKSGKIKKLEDAQISVWIPNSIWIFFWLKIISMLFAYFFILKFLYEILFCYSANCAIK